MNKSARIAIALAVVAAGIQLIPVDRSNPPAEGPLQASPPVLSVLEKSCQDCHSNRTVWPWYAHVAPVSWLLARDVHEGRRHLNFSNWQTYSPRKQAKLLEEIWEEVDEGEMPLGIYVALHGDAALSDGDKAILHDWTRTARAALPVTTTTEPAGADGHDHDHDE